MIYRPPLDIGNILTYNNIDVVSIYLHMSIFLGFSFFLKTFLGSIFRTTRIDGQYLEILGNIVDISISKYCSPDKYKQ